MERHARICLLGLLLGLVLSLFAARVASSDDDGVPGAPVIAEEAGHWSFEPLSRPMPPAIADDPWARSEIDRFILARLRKEGLAPAPEASRLAWLRRVTFDLTGLPPAPEEVESFLADAKGDAYARVVDRLLASPRYGERWAQHWLDVVRYADTHGFEVNTERPNAWPYRDYVISAFNRDLPYARFIREQIAGDVTGVDAATGFLVTASVLLPGQIGQDAPSMRLARQDAIDEIVNNIGQTFLGLSIACARCHDHKFDPISQEDYYAMQAFVAGVEYEERPLRTSDSEARRSAAERARRELAKVEDRLADLAPLARVGAAAHPATNPRVNDERFPALAARFVRFTIYDANLHPTLGLIEPCIDELEIYTHGDASRNVALAEVGTTVTASGSRTSASHRLEYVNDGRFGNSRSWMAGENGRGWLLFELPEVAEIDRVVWSRDREGQFTDRLATAYRIEAGLSMDAMETVVFVPPLRPRVSPRKNVDRFAPIEAKRIRFTILATNGLEPCIDELEVFDVDGANVGAAAAGAIVTSSGDTTVQDRHELRFVHDGSYGNSRSWMSSEVGKGWVELELPDVNVIDRVVWGRDRTGAYADRLATEYRIEVAGVSGAWRTVAESADRKPFQASGDAPEPFVAAELLSGAAREAKRLLEEGKRLEADVARLSAERIVFAGKFREPDEIHVLRRGDPEQPKEEVGPAVPRAIGTLVLASDTKEAARRKRLADWIASPENPLTARVMANRIWQGHFGVGLVDTPNDFGRNGSPPSHPELLDWLAAELLSSGGSIKHLHRLIVLSATYRQSTRHDEAAAAKDAGVRLLWRYPSRRLEGEAIRDAILCVSGRLGFEMGGPGFDLFDKRGGLTGFVPVESFPKEGLRRMIYSHKVRRERDAVFGVFDCPDGGQSTPRRRESTTPLQALSLFNSRFVIEEARAFAARVEAERAGDLRGQIQLAVRLALSRDPTEDEMADALPLVRELGLAVLCRALFNSNEFLFLP